MGQSPSRKGRHHVIRRARTMQAQQGVVGQKAVIAQPVHSSSLARLESAASGTVGFARPVGKGRHKSFWESVLWFFTSRRWKWL
jgi:hypothetical protein